MDPSATFSQPDFAKVAIAMFLNAFSISVFALVIYFQRHRRKDLALVFWFFNMCLFVTVSVIQMTEVPAALGFGLFAILSIIRLRSEPFNNREIAYFIGALVLGLLNGIGTPTFAFTLLLNAVLLVSMFLLDHPLVLRSDERRHIIFDKVIADDAELREALGDRLNMYVVDVTVLSVDFVKDSMELEVSIRANTDPGRTAPAMSIVRQEQS